MKVDRNYRKREKGSKQSSLITCRLAQLSIAHNRSSLSYMYITCIHLMLYFLGIVLQGKLSMGVPSLSDQRGTRNV